MGRKFLQLMQLNNMQKRRYPIEQKPVIKQYNKGTIDERPEQQTEEKQETTQNTERDTKAKKNRKKNVRSRTQGTNTTS